MNDDNATPYTLAAAATKLGHDISTVRRQIKSGKLHATKDAAGRWQVWLDEGGATAENGHDPSDVGELAALRAHIATLTAEVEARRTAEAELRRLLMQAQAMVPRLHDPADYTETPDASSPQRRRWWQRGK